MQVHDLQDILATMNQNAEVLFDGEPISNLNIFTVSKDGKTITFNPAPELSKSDKLIQEIHTALVDGKWDGTDRHAVDILAVQDNATLFTASYFNNKQPIKEITPTVERAKPARTFTSSELELLKDALNDYHQSLNGSDELEQEKKEQLAILDSLQAKLDTIDNTHTTKLLLPEVAISKALEGEIHRTGHEIVNTINKILGKETYTFDPKTIDELSQVNLNNAEDADVNSLNYNMGYLKGVEFSLQNVHNLTNEHAIEVLDSLTKKLDKGKTNNSSLEL